MEPTDVAFAGVARQAELIREREISPRELVELCLGRIERYDGRLRAFRTVFAERALAEAKQAGARRRGSQNRPLLGVPLAVKDDIDVAGEVTGWGSRATGDRPAAEDAELVRRVREAGAIVIGKTNVPELMIWPFTESAAFGATRNPWNDAHTPGGSSGGSAAAVAAGMVAGATGSDGGGSIRIPSAACGLFGLKPQRGRISLAPRPQSWNGMSVDGWLTRRVGDTALLMDLTAGSTEIDADRPEPLERPLIESAAEEPKGLRIAVATNPAIGFPGPDEEVRGAIQDTAALLRDAGHQVDETRLDWGTIGNHFIARWAAGIAEDADLTPHPERLERRTKGMVRLGRLTQGRMDTILAAESKHSARINRVLDNHDLVLMPVLNYVAPEVGRWEGRGPVWTMNGVGRWCAYTAAWNTTGQPAAAVPAGFGSHGLPLSVQLVGKPGGEPTIVAVAAQLETRRRWPEQRPSLD